MENIQTSINHSWLEENSVLNRTDSRLDPLSLEFPSVMSDNVKHFHRITQNTDFDRFWFSAFA